MRWFLLILGLMIPCQSVHAAEPGTGNDPTPGLTEEEKALITEAYHLWRAKGDKLWPGWTEIDMPMVFITRDYEYALHFPKALKGFQQLTKPVLGDEKPQWRKRVLSAQLAASFYIDGFAAVVIGGPEALEKSSGEWVITALHEMFHVLQSARGSTRKVAELKLGSESDPSWQLNFPFPYKDADVMRLIHLQGYLAYLAVKSGEESDLKYNAGAALEAGQAYRSFLKHLDAEGRFAKYSQFQEWTEGCAFYTECRMAEAAAADYQPAKGFRQLKDFKSYQRLWEETYRNKEFLAKHAGRAAQSRTVFYHLGLSKCLLLDRLDPTWKGRYFAANVWLDDLLAAPLR